MGVFIIAEAGVNHNGSLAMALQLVEAAAAAGADAVKFQTFNSSRLASRHAAKAQYQVKSTGSDESQLDMLRRLELSPGDHDALIAHAKAQGIEFLSTPFDTESLQLLTGRFGLTTIKISSGDLTNAPLLLDVARVSRNVILSTGMATLADVEAALGVLAFGWTAPADAAPGRAAFETALASDAGQQALRQQAVLLHCTTEYPAPIGEVNLRAMDTLAAAFGLRVGYSDHTAGIHVSIAAVARGAVLVEKHFTLDRDLPGPDHKASLVPQELAAMVAAIRDVERALGDGIKRPAPAELGNRDVARKSLVAARDLRAGEPFELECKRPGTGLSPFRYWDLLGRKARRDYKADEAIDE